MRRLSFLQVELSDLQGFSGLTFEQYQADRHTRREVERLIENLAKSTPSRPAEWPSGNAV